MRKFKELKIWQEGRYLAKEIYLLSNYLPETEKFGITSQIKRCVISIPSNIAEGAAKTSQKDFGRFLQISLGSCFELESHLILCNDLNLLKAEHTENIFKRLDQLQRQISALLNYTLKVNEPSTNT
jgi:four helix bundle protein